MQMLWNHTDCLTSILILFIKNKKYVFNIYVPMVFYSFLRAMRHSRPSIFSFILGAL